VEKGEEGLEFNFSSILVFYDSRGCDLDVGKIEYKKK